MISYKSKSNFLLTVSMPTRNYLDGVKNIIIELQKKRINKIKFIFFENSTDNKIFDYLTQEKKKNNFEIIRSDNLNFIDHWNKILKLCETEYLLMLHHDEIISIDIFEKLIQHIEKNKKDFYIFRLRKKNHMKSWKIGYPNFLIRFFIKFIPKLILYNNFIGPLSAFCFRINKNYHFDSNVKYFVDMHFFYQVIISSKDFFIFHDRIISDTTNVQSITKELSHQKAIMTANERKYLIKRYNINYFLDLSLFILSKILRVFNAIYEKLNKYIFF